MTVPVPDRDLVPGGQRGPGQAQRPGVERGDHQRLVPHEREIARAQVPALDRVLDHDVPLPARERDGLDAGLGQRRPVAREQDRLLAGQQLRVAVVELASPRVGSGQDLRRATLGVEPGQSRVVGGREVDLARRAPGPAPEDARRDPDRRPPVQRKLVEPAPFESDPPPIRGEEWSGRAFRPGKRAPFRRAQLAQVEAPGSLVLRGHDDPGSVRRDGDAAQVVVRQPEVLRQHQGDAARSRRRRGLAAEQGPAEARRDEDERREPGEEPSLAAPGGSGCEGTGLTRLAGDRVLEQDAGVGDVVQALLRVAREAAAEQVEDASSTSRRQRRPVRLAGEDRREHVAHRLALEEPPGR